jgi:hypothetical protein
MEPDSSSPYLQVPTTRPYPEPTPSSPHDPLQLPEDSSHNWALQQLFTGVKETYEPVKSEPPSNILK